MEENKKPLAEGEEKEETVSKNFIEREIDKDLAEGVYDHVQTRFPPEPNGYLHIGHAKSIILNSGLAKEYNGKFNLRFDDTNPTKEKTEFVESIIEDVKWLGADFEDRLFFASNYFQQMYECAVLLIKKGKAFVCDLTADQIREYRGDFNNPGKESPYRNRSIEENLQLFEEMKEGKYADGEKVLRAKIDMASPNINMRDPVIYRVAHMHHHNTGDKWCIYPMYDFAHPIEDAIEHITHSICTLEFEDHRPLYDWVVKECEFENPPRQIEFAKMYLTNVITGKRYIKKLVEDKIVDGWDDPRLVTIAALRRRGYTPESIRRFVELAGVSKADNSIDSAMLEYGPDLGFHKVEKLETAGKRVVFQGLEGAYGHAAALQFFGKDADIHHVRRFEDMMVEIQEGKADFAVLPIENSSAGAVTDNYDLLLKYDNVIVAETFLPVHHYLLGTPDAELSDVKRVYAHPQALMQSSDFLNQHDWQQLSMENNAVAAQKVRDEKDPSQAAVAGEVAGEIYGLKKLAGPINNCPDNTTRFLILAKERVYQAGAEKISLCFELPHRSGTLYSMLGNFIFNDVNMRMIESRPIPEESWQYRFFVDIEGNLEDAGVQNALYGIMREAKNVKILGNY